MKKPIIFAILIMLVLTGCNEKNQNISSKTQNESTVVSEYTSISAETGESSVESEEKIMNEIEIKVGNSSFKATPCDNETAKAFLQMLPMSLDMSEHNGNEKYKYLKESLPSHASRPSGIKSGDIMLFGSDCIVLFYKNFSTSYSYTPVAHMEDASGLAEALGKGSTKVSFSLS